MITQDDIERAQKFFDENGYYVAPSPQQLEIAKLFVEKGEWQAVKSEWFPQARIKGWVGITYVHASVKSKYAMPLSLHNILLQEPDFFRHEIVEVEFKVHPEWQPGTAYGEITNKRTDEGGCRYEVTMIGTNSSLWVPREKLRRTFTLVERQF